MEQPASENESTQPSRFTLPTALVVAIACALLLTGVSTALYLGSNFSRIDLSKPKNADIRSKVNSLSEATSNNSGPITRESINEAIRKMKGAETELQKAGDFNSPVLDDSSLGIPSAE